MPFSPAIEACRVPDERLAGAYEETSAAHRSWIKTTLALAEATYPAPPSRLTTIKDYDRILVLGEEGIVEEGTHAQLLEKQGVYYRLWNQLPAEDGE